MEKNLHDYLMEADTEHEIKVLSIANLWENSAEIAVRAVLARYGLRLFEKGETTPFTNNPKEFPNSGMVRIYRIVAKVAKIPTTDIATEIAYRIFCPATGVVITDKSEKPLEYKIEKKEPYKKPLLASDLGEHELDETPDMTDLVGDGRVKEIIKNLVQRDKDTSKLKGNEIAQFVLTHLGVKDYLKEDVPKGYYLIGFYKDGTTKILREYDSKKDNNAELVYNRSKFKELTHRR